MSQGHAFNNGPPEPQPPQPSYGGVLVGSVYGPYHGQFQMGSGGLPPEVSSITEQRYPPSADYTNRSPRYVSHAVQPSPQPRLGTGTVPDIFQKCEAITRSVTELTLKMETMQEKAGDAILDPSGEIVDGLRDDLADSREDLDDLRDKIKELCQSGVPPQSVAQVRMVQKRLNDLAACYNATNQALNDADTKRRRTSQAVLFQGADEDPDRIQDFEDPNWNAQQVITQGVLNVNRAGEVKQKLAKAQERRLRQVRLEKAMDEVIQVALELTAMLDKQGIVIKEIQQVDEEVLDDLKAGNKDLVIGTKYGRSANSKKRKIYIIGGLITAIVIITVCVYVGFLYLSKTSTSAAASAATSGTKSSSSTT